MIVQLTSFITLGVLSIVAGISFAVPTAAQPQGFMGEPEQGGQMGLTDPTVNATTTGANATATGVERPCPMYGGSTEVTCNDWCCAACSRCANAGSDCEDCRTNCA